MANWNKKKSNVKKYCQCGYCGDSTGEVFYTSNIKKKYKNKKHYLMHQYNGVIPLKRVCKCGCGRVFYTINPNRYYIKEHQKKFRCEVCQVELETGIDIIKKKNIHGDEFIFCINCWNDIEV